MKKPLKRYGLNILSASVTLAAYAVVLIHIGRNKKPL